MEWIAFAASAVTAVCALIGTYFSNRKQTALMDYRLKQLETNMTKLEDKVGKHNNLEGRIIALETHVNDLHAG